MTMHKEAREREEIYKIGGLRDQIMMSVLPVLLSIYGDDYNLSEKAYMHADNAIAARKQKDVK